MKLFHYLLFLVIIFSTVAITSCQKEEMKKEPAMSEQEQIEYGKYLVEIGGCHDCHSPKKMTEQGPVPDENLLLSGHPADQPIAEFDKSILKDWALMNHSLTAAVGPWGVSFAANITSDGTGIGNWTYEQFENALRKGWYKGLEGGRPIMPPMPWQTLINMKDKDMRAIFAYLKSTKPIKNVPPGYIPPDQM
jgi:mono/diheme cytochrome c family protein